MQIDLGRTAPNPQHAKNRIAYAERIVNHIDRELPSAKVVNLLLMNQQAWDRLARMAGEERPPSQATVAMIVGIFHGRELALNAVTKSVTGAGVVFSNLPAGTDPHDERF